MPGKLSASLEDYLEAIYHLVESKQVARVKDIARCLKVSPSSVTGALQALRERQLINYEPYDVITMTEKGTTRGRDIVRRHNAINDFFTNILHLEEDEANKAACAMEHAISGSIIDRLAEFMDYMENCPHARTEWRKDEGFICSHTKSGEGCSRCTPLIS